MRLRPTPPPLPLTLEPGVERINFRSGPRHVHGGWRISGVDSDETPSDGGRAHYSMRQVPPPVDWWQNDSIVHATLNQPGFFVYVLREYTWSTDGSPPVGIDWTKDEKAAVYRPTFSCSLNSDVASLSFCHPLNFVFFACIQSSFSVSILQRALPQIKITEFKFAFLFDAAIHCRKAVDLYSA